jgi:tRNA pseudouridine38-40 synthase
MMPTFAFVPIDGQVTEAYRITPEVLERVRKTLKIYLGTKNFHNFTSRKKSTDPSSNRYILDFTCSDPFIKDGLEYVILRVRGQSFMLHQIRKMIGLVTAILRGFANMGTVEKTWTPDRIDIPKAPGVGLVLDQVHYDRYNERFGSDGIHEKLNWEEQEENVVKFCEEFVYPVITKTENEEKSMLTWLETLIYHTYDIREHGAHVHLSPIGEAAIMACTKKIEADSSDEDDDDEDSTHKSKRRKIFHKK